jgi:hypothetical protein
MVAQIPARVRLAVRRAHEKSEQHSARSRSVRGDANVPHIYVMFAFFTDSPNTMRRPAVARCKRIFRPHGRKQLLSVRLYRLIGDAPNVRCAVQPDTAGSHRRRERETRRYSPQIE